MSKRALGAAALALGLAWLTAPGLPLYDGVGFPDEPYRYVKPPSDYRHTRPPTSAVGHVAAQKGASVVFSARSAEKGPQVDIYSGQGAFAGTSKIHGFTVTAVPVAPGPATSGFQVDGNAYRLTITSTPPGPVTVTKPTDERWAYIALRATSAKPHGPKLLYRSAPGKPWRAEDTEQTGNDVFAALVVGPGDYALGYPPGSQDSGTRSGLPASVVLPAVTVGIVAAIVVAIRITRRRPE